MDEKIRINKYLSEAGICSRREADRMIEEGRITVNGKKAESGQKVSLEDEVCADNIPVHKNEKKVLLLFNKPRGIVCSTKQQFDETTVTDYLDYPLRVYPVGRLDKESQGLLLLTNEGDLVNKIMRAGNRHEKEYKVTVDKEITEQFIKKMSEGVPILDTVTRPCTVKKIGKYTFSIILTQGLNRQIRRMCAAFGYEVKDLVRIRIMNIRLGSLKEGAYRKLTDEELEAFSQNQDLINDYVDEEGNLVFSRPEAYTTEEVLLLNGKTLETCRISAKEDLNEYSLETFASNMFGQMQEDMDEISLPQTWSTGKYKGYAISAVPKDSTLHYKYYYLHEKSTFVEIITTGFSDHVKVGDIIES